MALNSMPRIVVSVAPGKKGAKGDPGELPADAMLASDYDADGDGAIDIAAGGTGAKSASTARLNLGLGDASVEDVVPVAKGGTGGTDATTARENLGLGALAVLDAITADEITDDSTEQAAIRTKLDIYSTSETAALLGDWDNAVINGGFRINQRAFAGGSLSAGVYGFDRWKAGTGGCSVSVASGVVTLNGPLVQIIETPDWAGKSITVSVDAPSGSIPVTLEASGSGSGSVSGTITAGSGRRSVTLAVPATATGNIALTLAPAADTTFKNVKAEIGSAATPYVARPLSIEKVLCGWFFERIIGRPGAANVLGSGFIDGTTTVFLTTLFRFRKRVLPTLTSVGGVDLGYSGPDKNISSANVAFASLQTDSCVVTLTTTGLTSGQGAYGYLAAGGDNYIDIDAEL